MLLWTCGCWQAQSVIINSEIHDIICSGNEGCRNMVEGGIRYQLQIVIYFVMVD